MKIRVYQVTLSEGEVTEVWWTDDQMKSLVNQFKNYIAMETGKTDLAVGTHTESVDDASDDMGHSGYKVRK